MVLKMTPFLFCFRTFIFSANFAHFFRTSPKQSEPQSKKAKITNFIKKKLYIFLGAKNKINKI